MPDWSLVPEFIVAGVVVGCTYALMGVAFVLNYRATRVMNLAIGAMGGIAVVIFSKVAGSVPVLLAAGAALLVSTGIGVLIAVVSDSGRTQTSSLNRSMATLGWLVMLTAGSAIVFGEDFLGGEPVYLVANTKALALFGVNITWAQVAVVVGTLVGLAGMAVFLQRVRLGVAMRAVADSRAAAELLGLRVHVVTISAWVMAAVLAAMAAILLRPFIVGSGIGELTALLISAYAAALIGSLRNLWITAAAAVGLGVIENMLKTFPDLARTPWPRSVPFVAVLVFLTLQGERLGRESAVEGT